MAESVDALVSNTSGFTSIPVRPRVWVQKGEGSMNLLLFFVACHFCCYFVSTNDLIFYLHTYILYTSIENQHVISVENMWKECREPFFSTQMACF